MIRVALLAVSVLAVTAGIASAADLHDPNNTFSDLLQLVKNNANQWSGRLRGFAVGIFWLLATIQLVWIMVPLAMRRAEIGELVSELLLFVVKTSFFFSLLTYSVDWGQAIVDSFRHAGATAASVPIILNPGDMFSLAVSLANTVSDIDTLNPVTGMGVMFSALVVLLSFTFIAAFMGVTLIESYIVINASMFFMGFGGAQLTREYALIMLRYAVSVGAKLFVLTLIVGLIMHSARDWQASYHHDSASTWTLVGLALVCAYLTKTIPELIQSLINGVSSGGGSTLGGMAAAGMTLGAAAAATISAKMAAAGLMQGGSGGGISNLINSSLSGGGSGNSAASAMNAMSGSGSSPSTGSASRGSGFSPSGSSSPAPSSSASSGSPGMKSRMANAAHAATAGTARVGGLMSAITVPGMEGAENLSIGPSPVTPLSGETPYFTGDPDPAQETPENVIRPESPDTPTAGGASEETRKN